MEFRPYRGAVLALIAVSWMACAAPNPLANGLTEVHEAQIIENTFAIIELADTFTPQEFEQRQRRNFEQMTPQMRETATEHLPTRVEETTRLQVYREAVIDRESAQLEIERLVDDEARVTVAVRGSNRYRSNGNPSKTQQVHWSLPWKITVEEGEIVMRHSGIRLKVF